MNRRFPLFIDLTDRPVTVIGGGPVGMRRACILIGFGARVTIISPAISGHVGGAVHIEREYREGDLRGAFLAVAATDSREVNRAVGLEAKRLDIPVSVADRAEECSFYFPAVCEGAGLVAGVVSGGEEHSKTTRAAAAIREILSEFEEKRKIRVGSRESRLAVIQSELVIAAIRAYDPAIEVELVTMKTTGDIILDRTLDKIGGKGLFVKELDAALLDGRVDITVHSSKDLPMDLNSQLPLVAISRREDARDVLVLPEGQSALRPGVPIGCSSARRTLQIKRLYPNVPVAPVRGNVQTRLRKLDSGEYAALVLAAAGLRRLGLEHRISKVFSVAEMLPAAGQGILAAQGRAGEDFSCLSGFHDRDAADCLSAERAFVRALNGGCSSPVAAYAAVSGDSIHLTGLNIDGKGRAFLDEITGPRTGAEALGKSLAERMRRE